MVETAGESATLFVGIFSDLVLTPVSSVCLGGFSSPGSGNTGQEKEVKLERC